MFGTDTVLFRVPFANTKNELELQLMAPHAIMTGVEAVGEYILKDVTPSA